VLSAAVRLHHGPRCVARDRRWSDRGMHRVPLVILSCQRISNMTVFLQAARCFVSLRECREMVGETAHEAERAATSEAISGLAVVFPHSAAGRSDALVLARCWLHGCIRSEGADEPADASGMRNCSFDPQQAGEGGTGPLAQGCSECQREWLEDSVERVCRAREANLDMALLRFWDSV
jgi:hypothetical protein